MDSNRNYLVHPFQVVQVNAFFFLLLEYNARNTALYSIQYNSFHVIHRPKINSFIRFPNFLAINALISEYTDAYIGIGGFPAIYATTADESVSVAGQPLYDPQFPQFQSAPPRNKPPSFFKRGRLALTRAVHNDPGYAKARIQP